MLPYNNKTVTGVDIAEDYSMPIIETGYANDVLPYPGLFNLVDVSGPGTRGVTRVGFLYDDIFGGADETNANERIMAVSHVEKDRNVLIYGADWRHFGEMDKVMQMSIDFITKQSGTFFPIELYTFAAKQVGSGVELNWSTAGEENSSHFEIERRMLDGTFASIANKDASNNSSDFRYYNYNDDGVTLGHTYVYRLKMVDNDGSFSYSDEKTVEMESATGSLTVGTVKPNPTNSVSTIDINVSESARTIVELYNAAGSLVKVVYNEYLTAGNNTITINVNDLAQGNYTLVVRSGQNTDTQTLNIIR